MRQLIKYFALIILLSCFSCSPAPIEKSEIRNLLDEYSAALSSKSAENVAGIFHTQAQVLPEGNNVAQGRAEIEALFKGLETIDFEENFEVQEVLPADDMVIVRTVNKGMWSSLESAESGSFTVKGQMILKRDNNADLKIFRYMYNSDLPERSNSSQPIKGSFAHVVYFWLKNPDDTIAREKFISSLSNFINNSEFIRSKHIGTPADTDRAVIDNSYTYSLIVTFDSKEDQDKYQVEEGHIKFIQDSKELWEKVVVYDSESLK